MQMAGTSAVARSFCRRASRNSAAGRKTDGAEGSLLARIGIMIVPKRTTGRTPCHTDRRRVDRAARLQRAGPTDAMVRFCPRPGTGLIFALDRDGSCVVALLTELHGNLFTLLCAGRSSACRIQSP